MLDLPCDNCGERATVFLQDVKVKDLTPLSDAEQTLADAQGILTPDKLLAQRRVGTNARKLCAACAAAEKATSGKTYLDMGR